MNLLLLRHHRVPGLGPGRVGVAEEEEEEVVEVVEVEVEVERVLALDPVPRHTAMKKQFQAERKE